MNHPLFKRMSVVIVLLIIAELFLTIPKLFAAAPPAIVIASNSVRAYHYVLETEPNEDILIILRFDLTADGVTGDGDWDDYTSAGAIVRLEDASSNLLASGHPLRIGQGLVGFYFASGVAPFSFNDSLFVSLVGNPITFSPQGGVSSSVSWTASVSASSTEESLEEDLLGMMSDFESELNDFITGDLLTSTGLINISTGRTIALEAFNLMETAAPDAFAVSQALINLEFNPPADQLQGSIDTGVSTIVNESLSGLSEAFGIAEPFVGFAIAVVFSAILGMIVSQTSEKLHFGILGFATGMVWWMVVGMVAVPLVVLMTAGLFIMSGIWLAGRLPQ